jgi:pimeloyl-ACP methyl ester carboxylesterase
MIHGNPGRMADWDPIVDELVATADVARFDLPGFGRSPCPLDGADAMRLDVFADVAVALAENLGWKEDFFLVGHSHGGAVAQVAAARHPRRIAGIVLLGAPGFPAHPAYRMLALPGAERAVRAMAAMFGAAPLSSLSRLVLRGFMGPIFSPRSVPEEEVERELQFFRDRGEILVSMVQVALGRPCRQLWRAAPSVRCPVLFLHGERDALVAPRCARTIHERIVAAGGQSTFRSLPGAGHMLVTYEAEEIAGIVRSFLAKALVGDQVRC